MHQDEFFASLLFLFSSMVLFGSYRIIMRWLDRKRVPSSPDLHALEDRLTRIEQIVESTAIEVERGQKASGSPPKCSSSARASFLSPGRLGA